MYEFELTGVLENMGCQKIRATGNNMQATCPFASWTHAKGKDTHPSFSVLIGNENKWNCFACGQKGTSLNSLVNSFQTYSGRDLGLKDENYFKQKLKQAGTQYHPRQSMEHGWYDYSDFKVFRLEDFARFLEKIPQYAVDRGITPAQAKKWKIGFDTDEQRLFIPIFDVVGKMVGYSERAIHPGQEPKYKHAQGFKRNEYLYGMHLVDKENPVACVSEGFMDVLNLDRNGVTNAYAIMGTAVSDKQIDFLSQFKEVWVFPHNDEKDAKGNSPGMTSALKLRARLIQRNVSVVFAPFRNGLKDVGDWTAEQVRDTLSELKQQSLKKSISNDDPFADESAETPISVQTSGFLGDQFGDEIPEDEPL